jgi:Putative MetA-pathway of phenol degradation
MVVRVFRMRLAWKLMWPIATLTWPLQVICAQDLSPRAYVIMATHSNAIILTCSFYDGSVLFNGTVPITGATGTYGVPVLSYYHSLGFFGRSANLTASLPYAIGTFQGELIGEHRQIYRSGLVDSTFRFSVNLKGGPAMPVQEFVKWKQKTLLGVSLKVVAPTGQYSPTKLVNWGSHRWSFKPEFGGSRDDLIATRWVRKRSRRTCLPYWLLFRDLRRVRRGRSSSKPSHLRRSAEPGSKE